MKHANPLRSPPAGKWQDIAVSLPVQGKPAIVRIYLPADRSPVEIESIQFRGKGKTSKVWSFADVEP